jgi:hypothetical protein
MCGFADVRIKNIMYFSFANSQISNLQIGYSSTAAIPGRTFPSKYSNIAPPPVET